MTDTRFAEECDIDVLMAYGRCLRPALYSSLRSSPSHPAGVSALRVTIAIASARFARKQWELRKSTAKSQQLFRYESATSRRVRRSDIGGSTAMTSAAFCRKSPRVPGVCWVGSWALGTSVSVRVLHLTQLLTGFAVFQTHGSNSSRRLIGWPSTMRESTSCR